MRGWGARGRTGGLAILPMYDRPEIASETDALWELLREAIRDFGLDAPEALTRDRPLRLVWGAPELVLGQTCGLPYASALARRVGLLGAPAYRIEGVAPGFYRSAIVVRADRRADGIGHLLGARAAINARDSQSGYGALMHAVAPHAREGGFFGEVVLTGTHAASIQAVASGRADLAAIDAVSWALAGRYDSAVARLRVLDWTEQVPGLPFITAHRRHADALSGVVAQAIGALPEAVRAALMIEGFVRFQPQDYDVIRTRLAAAHAKHRLPGPAY